MCRIGKKIGLTVLLVFTLFLSACSGGGGGGSTTTPTTATTSNVTISGTASDSTTTASSLGFNSSAVSGSVGNLAGATVKAIKLDGTVAGTTTTDANGNYTLDVPKDTDYIIRITKGNVMIKALVTASSSDSTADVNPRSSAIVRSLADSIGNANFGEEGTDVSGDIDTSTLATTITTIIGKANFATLITNIKDDINTNGDYDLPSSTTITTGGGSTRITVKIIVTITKPKTTTPADTTAPSKPVITTTTSTTNNTTPTIVGTAEAGSTVTLYDTNGTTLLGTATATSGSWSITSSTLSETAHTITAKAKDSAGNVSSASTAITVTIDTTAPTVSNRSPVANATDIALNSPVAVTFSEAIKASTVTTATFNLGESGVAGTVAMSSGNTIATFTPTSNLAGGTTYTGVLKSGITDVVGNSLTLTTWNFTTGWAGTKQMGTSVAGKEATGNAVATDSSGNVFAAGDTNGNLDGNTLAGTKDLFVTKYDFGGVKQWTKQLGLSTKQTTGRGVATDSSGSVFVAGDTSGNLVTGSGASTGSSDLFVTKLNPATGAVVWTKQLGVSLKSVTVMAVATDSSGNIFVAGYTDGNLVTGSGASTGSLDFFVTKYNSAGAFQWTKQLGVAGFFTFGRAVATDGSGNVFVTGETSANLVTGSGASTGTRDAFVTKYDSAGTKQWTKQLGITLTTTFGKGIATDSSGNVFVGGYTSGNLVVMSGASTGSRDFFVTKLNPNTGAVVWTKQIGVVAKFTNGNAVATDSSGNIFVSGATNGGLDGNTISAVGSTDFFVTKYDSTGLKQWTKEMGNGLGGDNWNGGTRARGVATDSNGNVFVGGETEVGLDGNTFSGTGSNDFFVTKYNSAGVKQ